MKLKRMRIKYATGLVQYCNHFSSLLEHDIVELDCSKSMLFEFPDYVAPKLNQCVIFNASDNHLVTLPDTLRLPQCKIFDVSRNLLVKLPRELHMPYVSKFLILNNLISTLPKDMTFECCTEFNISFNKISRLSCNILLDKCRVFNINQNLITEIPPHVCLPNCTSFRIGNNPIKSLNSNIKLKNCVEFVLYNSDITRLPEDLSLPNCTQFEVYDSSLRCLPNNLNLKKCKMFNCAQNRHLISLGNSLDLPNCEIFYADENNLKNLPPDLNLPVCILFNVKKNKLETLPNNMNLDACQIMHLEKNRLKSLPNSILNCHSLKDLHLESNEHLHLPLQFLHFIRRVELKKNKVIWIPDDPQNVHNSSIQKSFTESIKNITSRKDVPNFEKRLLSQMLVENKYLTFETKQKILEYMIDQTQHSILLLKYDEILWAVLHTIDTDFDIQTQQQIYNCLDVEIKDSENMCFTGRINRLINCLNGFSSLVKISVPDADFIPYIIKKVETELGQNYSFKEHKKIVEKELLERGYEKHIISIWVDAIE